MINEMLDKYKDDLTKYASRKTQIAQRRQELEAEDHRLEIEEKAVETIRQELEVLVADHGETNNQTISNENDPRIETEDTPSQSPAPESDDFQFAKNATSEQLKVLSNGNQPHENGRQTHAVKTTFEDFLREMTIDMSNGKKRLIDAVTDLLDLRNKPMTNREIEIALRNAKYQTTAVKFRDTIRRTLKNYLSPEGSMLWKDRRWHLARWYQEKNKTEIDESKNY